MKNNLVMDFDGTLVVENSTRVLERLAFDHYVGKLPGAVNWIFFGAARRWLNASSSILGRISGRRIDWRFVLFLRIVSGRTSRSFELLCEDTASGLTINIHVLDSLDSPQQLEIISCGLTPVIAHFVRTASLDAKILAGSSLVERPGGRISAKMLEPRDKISVLASIPNLEYLTDDEQEARWIARGIKSDDVAIRVSKRDGIYRVTSSNRN
jgi:hypothetical protein